MRHLGKEDLLVRTKHKPDRVLSEKWHTSWSVRTSSTDTRAIARMPLLGKPRTAACATPVPPAWKRPKRRTQSAARPTRKPMAFPHRTDLGKRPCPSSFRAASHCLFQAVAHGFGSRPADGAPVRCYSPYLRSGRVLQSIQKCVSFNIRHSIASSSAVNSSGQSKHGFPFTHLAPSSSLLTKK